MNDTANAHGAQQPYAQTGLTNIARRWTREGFIVIPVPLGTKKPALLDWQNLRITEREVDRYFAQPCNLGLLLGEPSRGVIDIDLDTAEAVIAAPFFFSPTYSYGRENRPMSHLLFICEGAKTQKYKFAEQMILEVRSTGTQSLIPPSIHSSGETYRDERDNPPAAEISLAALEKAASCTAAAALLARHWQGGRHDMTLSLVGALLHGGWSDNEVSNFVEAVAGAALDEEVKDRIHAAQDTINRFRAGEKVTGWPTLSESLGKGIVEKARKWLHLCSSSAWPDPQPVQATLPAVPAFDADTLLPEPLRTWIMDEADRMPCPPDFVAAAALVALGSIIGAHCAIKPKAADDWLIVPNLWGGIVALPSDKKTPAISAALKPLDRLIAKAMDVHQAAMEAFEADRTVSAAQQKAIEKRIEQAARDAKKGDVNALAIELQDHRRQAPQEPVMRRYKSNDPTAEKLGELLRQNEAGILVLRDELVGLLASWEREGREADRAFYLEGWNGCNAFDTDRIGRGSIFIRNHCISIFGGIQPDKLTLYLEQATHALANDGMLQRFQLLVYPDHCPWQWRDRTPNKQARDCAFDVFETLADFDPVTWGASPADDYAKFPYFRFDKAAQDIFIEWSTDLHTTRLPAEEHPIIQQHLAKFDKLMPALALILHLADCAACEQCGPVSERAALRAAAWCEYLEAHARRCYSLLIDGGLRAAQALAAKINQGKLPDQFTARDVRRNRWRHLTTAEAVQAALEWLEDNHWISGYRESYGQNSGKSPWRYLINPKILKTSDRGAANADVCDERQL